MNFYTRGYENMQPEYELPQPLPIRNSVGEDDTILRDIFAPDPLTGNPTSDVFIEGSAVNDKLREYIVNVLRTPQNELTRLSDADDALRFSRGLDESKEEYISRIMELVTPKEG